jgi:hypothetical protein
MNLEGIAPWLLQPPEWWPTLRHKKGYENR